MYPNQWRRKCLHILTLNYWRLFIGHSLCLKKKTRLRLHQIRARNVFIMKQYQRLIYLISRHSTISIRAVLCDDVKCKWSVLFVHKNTSLAHLWRKYHLTLESISWLGLGDSVISLNVYGANITQKNIIT